MTIATRPPEADLYRQLWDDPLYRVISPGEHAASEFLKQAQPRAGASVLDLGCGTGRGGLMLAVLGGMNVTMLDFAPNCLDADIREMLLTQSHCLRFMEADLSQSIPVIAEYGFACDVMEHLPPEQVDAALNNILMACRHCFFQIATVPDKFGTRIDLPLHLSVHDYAWWAERFRERDCLVHWAAKQETYCQFYVTAWTPGPTLVEAGVPNTEEEQLRINVRANIAGDWKQAAPYEAQDTEVLILGGSPSLGDYEDEIRELREGGAKLVTLNGAYNWCLERGLTPSATVIVDARAFNARFVQPTTESTLYLISSQCDPSVFAGLPPERTWIWHTSAECIQDLLSERYECAFMVPGGSTVLLRAIPLLRMLGYHRFRLYGCDSCLMQEEHHAYDQPENNSEIIIPVEVGGRIFRCHPWMCVQAQEWITLLSLLGDEIEVCVAGDGLLAWIIQHAAEEGEREEADAGEQASEGGTLMKRNGAPPEYYLLVEQESFGVDNENGVRYFPLDTSGGKDPIEACRDFLVRDGYFQVGNEDSPIVNAWVVPVSAMREVPFREWQKECEDAEAAEERAEKDAAERAEYERLKAKFAGATP